MNNNFAVFITTHGRPKNQKTYISLRKHGYTGKIYFVIDNEDDTAKEYREFYGEQVIMFDKKAVAEIIDAGDNIEDRRAVVYARNAVFNIAKDLGFDYFMQTDDDYTVWEYRFGPKFKYNKQRIKNLDAVFDVILDYFKTIDAYSIAMSQGGDFFGGKESQYARTVGTKRKVMQTFFCKTNNPFPFFGRMNDDVNTYVTLGNRGKLFFTIFQLSINQPQTQSVSGGMTDIYLNEGTYRKSFYTVMYAPHCAEIKGIGTTERRLHHSISWRNAVPCVLNEKYRKWNSDD
jgi:hypothetical protein